MNLTENDVSVSQEKLPTRVRSIGAVYRFVSALLNSRNACSFDAVQDIRLTPPFDGEAESKRAFKGFAFVTLSSTDDAERLLEDFPWLSGDRSGHVPDGLPASTSADVIDAHKYGVRTIAKARWEELRDEYFAYRTQLLNIVHKEGRNPETAVQPKPGIAEPAAPPSMSNVPPRRVVPQDYPRGCLIFARNIHTETNKTTLRKLFSSAVGFCQDVLDYVDFNKGMDSVSLGRFPAILAGSRARFKVFPAYQKLRGSLQPRRTFQYQLTRASDWFRRRRYRPFRVSEGDRLGVSRGEKGGAVLGEGSREGSSAGRSKCAGAPWRCGRSSRQPPPVKQTEKERLTPTATRVPYHHAFSQPLFRIQFVDIAVGSAARYFYVLKMVSYCINAWRY